MPMIDTALAYLKMGFSVIPVGKDKKSLIKWEIYQKRLATEEEVQAWFKKWPDANIGIVTGIISNLAVIDVDTEEGQHAIQEYLPKDLDTPIAHTPKGGNHIYFCCPDSNLSNNTRVVPGCDLRANGGYVLAPPSVNGNGKGYRWIEGLSIEEVEPEPLPDAYIKYLNINAFNKGDSKGECKGPVTLVTLSFDEGNRDNTLFHIANVLAKGGMPEAEALETLARLASTCNPPFPKDELEAKIVSAIKRQEHREINLTREIERWVSVTNGNFSVTDAYNELQSVTGVTKHNNYRVILNRLNDRGLIQRIGDRDRIFRRVENIADEIDWWSASTEPVKIKFPLQVEDYVAIHPKNIIVIAGEPNAGKTAYMLNLAGMNTGNHKVAYLSSEMGAIELRTRLSKFDLPLSHWKAIKFKERAGNFSDVIEPDGFTIVDFLEITDDFYRIATFIKEIHDKLNKGICVIGIQKNKGHDTGRGGELGLEKPRLYLAMEPGKIKIVKAKAWAKEGINPNGLQREFKLVQGAKFITNSPWHRESEI